MRSCQQRNHYSCPSSSTLSPSDSPSYGAASIGCRKVMNGRTKSFTEARKLIRQRKLRYATDNELGLDQINGVLAQPMPLPLPELAPLRMSGSNSVIRNQWSSCYSVGSPESTPPVSPESMPEMRSPWSSYVPHPMPLPLPELVPLRLSGLNSMIANQGSPCSSVGRPFPFNYNNTNPTDHPLPQRNTHCTKRDDKPLTFSRRGFPEYLNLECHNLRSNSSAPSSPVISPTKSRHPFPGGWSALEKPSSGRAGKKSSRNADHSPVHSPTARRDRTNFLFLRSPKSVSFPVRPKLSLFDSPRTRYENRVAHPLPLPPQGSCFQGYSFKPNSSRGQWQKGKLIRRRTFGSVYTAINRETGALCAMKEVDLIPDDPKCVESVQQLEQFRGENVKRRLRDGFKISKWSKIAAAICRKKRQQQ